MPIIKNCDLYIGNDTGAAYFICTKYKMFSAFMDSPVQAYGKYSKNIETILPEGKQKKRLLMILWEQKNIF